MTSKGFWQESKRHGTMVYSEKVTAKGKRCDVVGNVRGWIVVITLYLEPCRAANYYIDVANCATFARQRVSATWLYETMPEMLAFLKKSAGVRMYKGV